MTRLRKPGARLRPSSSPVSGSQAWQILYRSTTASGQPTAISGTVLVPSAAHPGTRPVMAYAPGTQGWGDQCAPSKEIAAGNFDEQFAVSNMLAKGWAVVVTDYPGLGTPGPEAYNVGIPEGYGVLDALRAATLLPPGPRLGTLPEACAGVAVITATRAHGRRAEAREDPGALGWPAARASPAGSTGGRS